MNRNLERKMNLLEQSAAGPLHNDAHAALAPHGGRVGGSCAGLGT